MIELSHENFSESILQVALEQLQNGQTIVLHTHDYYTLVCDATNIEAVNSFATQALKCQMQLTVIMSSEREILHHTASIDLAIFDALVTVEANANAPIAFWCNGALNVAMGVENSRGQFLIHKTSNDIAKQLIKRLRNPICCMQVTASSDMTLLQKLYPILTSSQYTSTTFFRALQYQPLSSGILEMVETSV